MPLASRVPTIPLENIILFPNNTDNISASAELKELWKEVSVPDLGKIGEELRRNRQISYYNNNFTPASYLQTGGKKKKKKVRTVRLRNLTNIHMMDDLGMQEIIGKK
jgi:uncharacterized protein YbcI